MIIMYRLFWMYNNHTSDAQHKQVNQCDFIFARTSRNDEINIPTDDILRERQQEIINSYWVRNI